MAMRTANSNVHPLTSQWLEGSIRHRRKSPIGHTGWRPDGPVELITHPRYLGYVFNPVSFYFCYVSGDRPETGAVPKVILAQITNTPWHERHVYCLETIGSDVSQAGWRSEQFDATLVVQRTPLTRKQLHKSLRQFPLEALKVAAGIYWHALKLKLKGVPFYTHPDKLQESDTAFRLGSTDSGLDVTETNNTDKTSGRVSSWRT